LPVIRTNVKEVYAYFEQKEEPRRICNIFVNVGLGSSQSSSELIYTGVYLTILNNLLYQQGYNSNIFIIAATQSPKNGDNNINASVIKIKDSKEQIDVNKLLIYTGDVRFYRGLTLTTYYFAAKIQKKYIMSASGYLIGKISDDMKQKAIKGLGLEKDFNVFINSIQYFSQIETIHKGILQELNNK